MSFKPLPCIVFCTDPACRHAYVWIRDAEEPRGLASRTLLPCGHPVGTAMFSDSCVRSAFNAQSILSFLDDNDLIVPGAYGLIERHGGVFRDVANCVPPHSKPSREELDEVLP